MREISVLFVCTGNICRSPTAEAVLGRHLVDAGLDRRVRIDSCGLGSWHLGDPPDGRAIDRGAARGYDLTPLRARQLRAADFTDFDMIIAMDRGHLTQMRRACPGALKDRLYLFMDFHPDPGGQRDVPDPYFGDLDDYDLALDLIEAGIGGLMARLRHDVR